MRPETELWIFAAGEDPDHSRPNVFCARCKTAVLSLLDYISTLPVPAIQLDNKFALALAEQHQIEHPFPRDDGTYTPSRGAYMRHLLEPKVITLGASHQSVVQICRDVGIVRPEFPGSDAELNKFLFRFSDLPEARELPKGLRWGKVREEDIDIIKERTSIPRSKRTLLSLDSLGVFNECNDMIIAWAFVGLDGSLTSLHTEAEFRGRGIAKAVAVNIIKKYMHDSAIDERGDAWSHADVYQDNLQSEIVCKSLGGNAMWKCFWLRIDLAVAGKLAYIP